MDEERLKKYSYFIFMLFIMKEDQRKKLKNEPFWFVSFLKIINKK